MNTKSFAGKLVAAVHDSLGTGMRQSSTPESQESGKQRKGVLDMHAFRLHEFKIAWCQKIGSFSSYYTDSLNENLSQVLLKISRIANDVVSCLTPQPWSQQSVPWSVQGRWHHGGSTLCYSSL